MHHAAPQEAVDQAAGHAREEDQRKRNEQEDRGGGQDELDRLTDAFRAAVPAVTLDRLRNAL
jgi:regulator of protease activity HflC (stomatin/prohibitin superfamily)